MGKGGEPEEGADRDVDGPGRGGSVVLVQHLCDAGPRGGRHCVRQRDDVCVEGRDAAGVPWSPWQRSLVHQGSLLVRATRRSMCSKSLNLVLQGMCYKARNRARMTPLGFDGFSCAGFWRAVWARAEHARVFVPPFGTMQGFAQVQSGDLCESFKLRL